MNQNNSPSNKLFNIGHYFSDKEIFPLLFLTFAAFKKMIIMEKNSNLPSKLKTINHGHSME